MSITVPPSPYWRQGTGAPSNAVGVNNDFYIDTAAGAIYQKSAGTYSIIYTVTGGLGAGDIMQRVSLGW